MLRRLLILVTLGAALAALTELSRLAANLDAAAPSDMSLWAANFETATESQELFAERDAAQIVDGELRLTVGSPDSLLRSAARPHFGEFDMSAVARPLAGPLDNGYGLLFQLRELRPAPLASELRRLLGRRLAGALPDMETAVTGSALLFLISSDGYYQLLSLGGRTGEEEERVLSAWMPASQIRQGLGVRNRLRAIFRGGALRIEVNGAPLPLCLPDDPGALSTWSDGCVGGQLRDSLAGLSVAPGRVGFVARTFQEAGVVVAFDDLVVRAAAAPGAAL